MSIAAGPKKIPICDYFILVTGLLTKRETSWGTGWSKQGEPALIRDPGRNQTEEGRDRGPCDDSSELMTHQT
jgi:hypothetical protein